MSTNLQSRSLTEAMRWLFAAVCAAWLLAVSGPASAQDAVVKQAAELLEKRDAQGAYNLLKPLEEKRAGEPDFDLLLGIAANDIGKHTEAIFALERVVAVRPKDARARAEIGRAYFQIGEIDSARQQLQTARELGVPTPVRDAIDKFIDAIAAIPEAGKPAARLFVEATAGYDSNVNAATGTGTFGVPAFGGLPVTLAAGATKQSDWFLTAGGGGFLRAPLTPRWSFLGGFNFNKRMNFHEDTFDTGIVDANAGFAYTEGVMTASAVIQGNEYYLDNVKYRTAFGGIAQVQAALTPRDQLSAFLQRAQLHYPGQEIRDVERMVLGAGYAHAFAGGRVGFLSGYLGNEDEKDTRFPHLGHDLYGIRAGVDMPFLGGDTRLFGVVRYEQRHYHGDDPLFLVRRKDTQYDLNLGVQYTPARNWLVTPQVIFVRNESNIVTSEYNRHLFQVTVRRDFAF